MTVTANGFTFDAPPTFETQETTLVLRAADRQPGAGPTLVFHARLVGADATLESLAAEVMAELAASAPEGKAPRLTDFAFSDGEKGVLVMHALTTPMGNVRQYVVLRLKDSRQATLMLAAPDTAENQASAPLFMQTFASLR